MTSPPTLQLDNITKFSPVNDDPPKVFKLGETVKPHKMKE